MLVTQAIRKRLVNLSSKYTVMKTQSIWKNQELREASSKINANVLLMVIRISKLARSMDTARLSLEQTTTETLWAL